jgi:hypothetical protein
LLVALRAKKKGETMKLEDRDSLNNIRGIARSIDVFTDQTEVSDLAREMIEIIDRILDSDRPLMSKEEGKGWQAIRF